MLRAAAEQQLAAATAKAASDGARWREEVDLKQARIDMLVAGDRAKEAEFMAQRVRELQVIDNQNEQHCRETNEAE